MTIRRLAALLSALALVLSLSPRLGASGDVWLCPPCDRACDRREFAAAGTCPECGMELRRRGEFVQVVILLFDGVQIIDFTAPYEVFGQAGSQGFRVTTAGRERRAMTTAMGLSVTPAHAFADAPAADVLVVPGGGIDPALDEATLSWVRTQARGARHVLSVCNGAFVLARAGLLDGLGATTFYGLIDELRQAAPRTRVVSDARYVDNGQVITTAGLSSGVEGSLRVIERLRGRGVAQQIALHMEYDWRPDGDFARAALADLHLPRLRAPEGARATLESTAGDRVRWQRRWRVEGTDAAALSAEWTRQLRAAGWTPREGGGFAFDSGGERWNGQLAVEAAAGGVAATLEIRRP
jgi:putative intracellular protease/amidase